MLVDQGFHGLADSRALDVDGSLLAHILAQRRWNVNLAHKDTVRDAAGQRQDSEFRGLGLGMSGLSLWRWLIVTDHRDPHPWTSAARLWPSLLQVTYRVAFPLLNFSRGTLMTIFDPTRTRVIDTGGVGRNLIRLIGLGIVAFILVILLFSSVTRVGTGHVGVLTLFGRVTGETLGEGIHLINPLKTNNEMSIQTQTLKESASVPSSEGLMMSLDTSLIYHLNPDRAAEVFQKIGSDYENVVVEPTLRSAIRESTASHTANALYTGEREMVAKQIVDQISQQLKQRGLTVENVLLRDIQLPATLKASIEAKQQAEQEALAMNFRLQKETQEAQRKRIEAAGVRDFQQIVAQGITPSLLEWKGIEATETLAKSPNTKVVVVGNSKNGLPLILGQ